MVVAVAAVPPDVGSAGKGVAAMATVTASAKPAMHLTHSPTMLFDILVSAAACAAERRARTCGSTAWCGMCRWMRCSCSACG